MFTLVIFEIYFQGETLFIFILAIRATVEIHLHAADPALGVARGSCLVAVSEFVALELHNLLANVGGPTELGVMYCDKGMFKIIFCER